MDGCFDSQTAAIAQPPLSGGGVSHSSNTLVAAIAQVAGWANRNQLDPTVAHESTFYGLIDAGEFGGGGDSSNPHFAANRTVLQSLRPGRYLRPENFHLIEPPHSYRSQLITIAGSFNYLESVWPAWLQEFEQLLGRLCWLGVDLHVDFDQLLVSHHFTWSLPVDADATSIREGNPVSGWAFDGGPREFPG